MLDKEKINYLYEFGKIIHKKEYDEDDIYFMYEVILSIDNQDLNSYNNIQLLTPYGDINNLDYFIKLVNFLIKYFEENELYENCYYLKKKIDESLEIKNKQKEEYEHIKNVRRRKKEDS